MTHAAVEYFAISVNDLERQRTFYAQAFGILTEEATLELPNLAIRSALVSADSGLRVEFIEKAGSAGQSPMDIVSKADHQGFTHIALQVENLEAAVEAVRRAGGSVLSEPAKAQRPGVRFAYVADPEGNLLELLANS